MAYELPKLPYAPNALEPHIDAKTMEIHHGKHHQTYVDKMNAAIAGTEHESKSLEEIVAASRGTNQGLFNNSAQTWNHAFYWHSMAPATTEASPELAAKIDEAFGSVDALKQQLKDRGVDVVLGFVETHGRTNTLAQIGDLEVVPRQKVPYRGTVFEEMDVDAVLRRRPMVEAPGAPSRDAQSVVFGPFEFDLGLRVESRVEGEDSRLVARDGESRRQGRRRPHRPAHRERAPRGVQDLLRGRDARRQQRRLPRRGQLPVARDVRRQGLGQQHRVVQRGRDRDGGGCAQGQGVFVGPLAMVQCGACRHGFHAHHAGVVLCQGV